MRKVIGVFAVLLVLAFALGAVSAEDQEYAAGQIIVGFQANVSNESANQLVESFNLTWEQSYSAEGSPITGIIFVPNGTEDHWIDIFGNESIVNFTQLNYLDSAHDECVNEDGMCGGLAGFACCSGLRCDLEGDYPDAAGTCIVDLPGDICEDKCGDDVCDETVCQGEDCPCAETSDNCPADCSGSVIPGGSGGGSNKSMWYLFIGLVVLVFLVIVGMKLAKWLFWSAIIAALLLVLLYVFVL